MFGSRETQRVTTQTVVSPTADANLLLPPPSAAPLSTPSSLCSRRRPPPPPSAPAAEAPPPPSRAPAAAAPSSSLCAGRRGPLLLPLLRPPRPALLPRGQRGRGRRGGRGRGGRAGVDGEGAHLGRGERDRNLGVLSPSTQNASAVWVRRWRPFLGPKTLFRTQIWVWVTLLEIVLPA